MYLIPQPLVLAPPRDDGLLYAVYVDGEEILHFVQNDNLSSPKHTHRPTPSRVPPLFVGYKNVTHDVVVVILSEAKDLKVYVTVDGRTH